MRSTIVKLISFCSWRIEQFRIKMMQKNKVYIKIGSSMPLKKKFKNLKKLWNLQREDCLDTADLIMKGRIWIVSIRLLLKFNARSRSNWIKISLILNILLLISLSQSEKDLNNYQMDTVHKESAHKMEVQIKKGEVWWSLVRRLSLKNGVEFQQEPNKEGKVSKVSFILKIEHNLMKMFSHW